jgi:hypothetical protein
VNLRSQRRGRRVRGGGTTVEEVPRDAKESPSSGEMIGGEPRELDVVH